LINALIHRDYINQGRDIKVGVYDDIVNIVSPGSYPNGINQEDIDSGRSDARNRVIANVFKELGLIEQWGSGIARIKKLCLNIGLKEPKIVEQNDFVDVEFYRPIVEDSVGNDRLRPIKTDYDQIILEYIEKNKRITRKEAKAILDIGETKIKELFNELIEKKIIQRIGAGRSTYYVLSKK